MGSCSLLGSNCQELHLPLYIQESSPDADCMKASLEVGLSFDTVCALTRLSIFKQTGFENDEMLVLKSAWALPYKTPAFSAWNPANENISSTTVITMTTILNPSQLLAAIWLCVVLILWRYSRKVKPSRLPLPPGPKGLPVIGNLFDFPNDKPWLVYDRWFKQYGMYLFICLQHASIWLFVQEILSMSKFWGNR